MEKKTGNLVGTALFKELKSTKIVIMELWCIIRIHYSENILLNFRSFLWFQIFAICKWSYFFFRRLSFMVTWVIFNQRDYKYIMIFRGDAKRVHKKIFRCSTELEKKWSESIYGRQLIEISKKKLPTLALIGTYKRVHTQPWSYEFRF